jgi:hypothetical protein
MGITRELVASLPTFLTATRIYDKTPVSSTCEAASQCGTVPWERFYFDDEDQVRHALNLRSHAQLLLPPRARALSRATSPGPRAVIGCRITNNSHTKHTYAGATDRFTHLRVLLVFTDRRILA